MKMSILRYLQGAISSGVVIEEIEIAGEEWAMHSGQDTIIIAIREGGKGGRLVFLKNAVERRAAAGKGGIEGAGLIERRFYRPQGGVELE